MVTLATAEDFRKHMESGLLMQLIREGVAAAVAQERAFGLTPVTQDNLHDVPAPTKARPSQKKSPTLASARKIAAPARKK